MSEVILIFEDYLILKYNSQITVKCKYNQHKYVLRYFILKSVQHIYITNFWSQTFFLS